jgi:hypothetical protein
MPYLVEKQGFGNESAAIFNTKDEADRDGKTFCPLVSFSIREITSQEAHTRWAKYIKRLCGKVPQERIKKIAEVW